MIVIIGTNIMKLCFSGSLRLSNLENDHHYLCTHNSTQDYYTDIPISRTHPPFQKSPFLLLLVRALSLLTVFVGWNG